MDHIRLAPDGKTFVYESSSSSSPSDTRDNVQQDLPEVPDTTSDPDTKMAAMQDPMVPDYGPEVFLPQDLDDLDNAKHMIINTSDIHLSLMLQKYMSIIPEDTSICSPVN